MKIGIELNIADDGRKFLNYWNCVNGNDVVCELKNGKLMLYGSDDEGNDLPEREISLQEFFQLVETKAPIEP